MSACLYFSNATKKEYSKCHRCVRYTVGRIIIWTTLGRIIVKEFTLVEKA